MNHHIFNRKATVTIGAGAWTSLVQEAGAAGWKPVVRETLLGEEGTDRLRADVIEGADAAALAHYLRGRHAEPEKLENLPELLAVLEGGEDVLVS